jgi:hypothetical protein
MVKIKKIIEIYGESFTVLIHLIHLRLNINGNDHRSIVKRPKRNIPKKRDLKETENYLRDPETDLEILICGVKVFFL